MSKEYKTLSLIETHPYYDIECNEYSRDKFLSAWWDQKLSISHQYMDSVIWILQEWDQTIDLAWQIVKCLEEERKRCMRRTYKTIDKSDSSQAVLVIAEQYNKRFKINLSSW